MILQCDQCNTKFRLDDSKLKPGGVKVRCSKCRHVFLAGAEQKHEESEFDALLSGLGAPAPAKAAEVAPTAAEQQAGAELAPLEFGGEPAEPQQKSADVEDQYFGDFDFTPETPSEPRQDQQQEPAAGGEFDFGDIDLGTGTAAGTQAPVQPAGGVDFGELDFSVEPVVAPKEAPAPANVDFGEFSFEETPSAPQEEKVAPAAADLDFGEFSFEETPSAPREEKAAPVAGDLDFGEFSFEEAPTAPKEEKAAPAAADLDFGEFSFEEAPSAPSEEKAAPAAADLDFGEFSFEEAPSAPMEEKAAPAADDNLSLGDFSFEEEHIAQQEEEPAAAAATMDFGDFTFDEETPGATEVPVPEVPVGSFPSLDQEEKATAPPASVPDEEFSFGEFSFPEEPEPQAVPKAAAAPQAGATAALAGAAGLFGAAEGKPEAAAAPVPPAGQPVPPQAASPLEFSFGDNSFATSVPEEAGEEEELPPLSIVSRRKGRSAVTIAIVAISVIVVVALSAAGIYLLQSGPAAMANLDKFGIGFVAQWFGIEVPEEGRITIRKPLASFHQNAEAGELFVVTGEAVNSFRKARASIQVKVSIFDKSGKVLLQKTAYCGNRLSIEQLATLPMEKIESIMNNQFGDSLSNLGVKPGEPIGFVVALANVPKEAADFGVEVVGSTVAAGQ